MMQIFYEIQCPIRVVFTEEVFVIFVELDVASCNIWETFALHPLVVVMSDMVYDDCCRVFFERYFR